MKVNLFSSFVAKDPRGLISSTSVGASVGTPEASFDELPTPTPLIAETL